MAVFLRSAVPDPRRELQTALQRLEFRRPWALDLVKLDREDVLPEDMVRIPGFTSRDVGYGDYFMDRYEVTNQAYQEFVDAGGYRNPEYWIHLFVRDGVELTWGGGEEEEAVGEFEDQTGRPGPSTWHLGTYPEGQADYPVGGVSWYDGGGLRPLRRATSSPGTSSSGKRSTGWIATLGRSTEGGRSVIKVDKEPQGRMPLATYIRVGPRFARQRGSL